MSRVPSDSPVRARRIEWARQAIARAHGPVPPYGSVEWLSLPDSDPRKIIAVVVAAESWARDGDDLEQRLWDECMAASRAHKITEDAKYVADWRTHRQTWAGGVHHPDPDLPAQLEEEFWDWVRGAA